MGKSGLSGEPVLIWSTKRNTPPTVGTSKALRSRARAGARQSSTRRFFVFVSPRSTVGDEEKRTAANKEFTKSIPRKPDVWTAVVQRQQHHPADLPRNIHNTYSEMKVVVVCAPNKPPFSLGVEAQPREVHADVGAEVRVHDVRDVFVLGRRHTLQRLLVVEKVHLHHQQRHQSPTNQ